MRQSVDESGSATKIKSAFGCGDDENAIYVSMNNVKLEQRHLADDIWKIEYIVSLPANSRDHIDQMLEQIIYKFSPEATLTTNCGRVINLSLNEISLHSVGICRVTASFVIDENKGI